MLIFNFNVIDAGREHSFIVLFISIVLSWAGLIAACRVVFGTLVAKALRFNGEPGAQSRLTAEYHRSIAGLTILSLSFFFVVVYIGDLRYWLNRLPLFSTFSVLEGAAALGLFVGFLCTVWYFAYPANNVIFRRLIGRRSFVSSNLRLNLPILFPWAVLSLLFDILALDAVTAAVPVLASGTALVICFVTVLVALMVVMPALIRKWWGCASLENSGKGRELASFLEQSGFRYRGLVRWPIFEGRVMTAGIMGIVSRFRYIMVTDALMEVLSVEELKGVLAHEMAHAKYRHLLFYVVFFVGFIPVSYGLTDLLLVAFLAVPSLGELLTSEGSSGISLVYLLISAPMLLSMVVYFRYIIGFFMRQFERQADLYAAEFLGTASPIIDSLEKIALYAGNSRDLPSWHHFSVRQRVDCLLRAERNPGLIRRHNRFVAVCLAVYLVCAASVGYLVSVGPVPEGFHYAMVERVLLDKMASEPGNAEAYRTLAMIYHDSGRYPEALFAYEKALNLEPDHPVALNNLAWLLATASDRRVRDIPRAVELAERAVALERNSMFLDTLAEAYYTAGRISEAVEVIDEAIERAVDNVGYYRGQREKFRAFQSAG